MSIVDDKTFARIKSHCALAYVCRPRAVVPTLRGLRGIVRIFVKVGAVGADFLDLDIADTLGVAGAGCLPRRAICLGGGDVLEVDGDRREVPAERESFRKHARGGEFHFAVHDKLCANRMQIVDDKTLAIGERNRTSFNVGSTRAVVPTSRGLGGVVGIHVKVVAVGADLLYLDVACTLGIAGTGRLPRCAICLDRGNALDVNGRRRAILERCGEEGESLRQHNLLIADNVSENVPH